jgi:hypothetical protein
MVARPGRLVIGGGGVGTIRSGAEGDAAERGECAQK